jgi:hypothetical protein
VPLFEAEPSRPAAGQVADEQLFADGDRLGVEGEMGDGLHVIVAGSVHVRSGGDGSRSVAGRRRRRLSLIARVRMADRRRRRRPHDRIARRAFGDGPRRPDVAIGVMRARHPAGRARIGSSG